MILDYFFEIIFEMTLFRARKDFIFNKFYDLFLTKFVKKSLLKLCLEFLL